ncbi:MAG: hypothetical protein GC137_02600 [Alphaproteobacteria bacterium]|nr:hypothetical protein [Alphaproteobacteria bacterium]
MTEYRIRTDVTLEGNFAAQAVPVLRNAQTGDRVVVDNRVLVQIVTSLLNSVGKRDVEVSIDEPQRPSHRSPEVF